MHTHPHAHTPTHSPSQLHSFLISCTCSLSLSYASLMGKEGVMVRPYLFWKGILPFLNCFPRAFPSWLRGPAMPCSEWVGALWISCVHPRAVPAPPHWDLLKPLWPVHSTITQHNQDKIGVFPYFYETVLASMLSFICYHIILWKIYLYSHEISVIIIDQSLRAKTSIIRGDSYSSYILLKSAGYIQWLKHCAVSLCHLKERVGKSF